MRGRLSGYKRPRHVVLLDTLPLTPSDRLLAVTTLSFDIAVLELFAENLDQLRSALGLSTRVEAGFIMNGGG